jgi:hypothetical protein
MIEMAMENMKFSLAGSIRLVVLSQKRSQLTQFHLANSANLGLQQLRMGAV